MRYPLILSAAAGFTLSGLAACSDPPPPAVPAPAPPAALPVAIAYTADVRPMNVKKQLLHSFTGRSCVDVKGDNAAQHAAVHLAGCRGKENQRWDFGPGAAGAVQVGGIGGLCLTLMSAPGIEGTMLELLTCNGTPAQEFRFFVDGRIQDLGGQRCVTATTGSAIVVAPCDAANPAQVWAVAGN
jgi:hypothetical protein